MNYLYLFGSIFVSVIGQVCLKKGVEPSTLTFNLPSIVKTFFTPLILVGFTLYGLSAILWMFVLQKFTLSTAYPFLSLTYVLILIIGALWLNEPLNFTKVIGVTAVILGVVLISR